MAPNCLRVGGNHRFAFAQAAHRVGPQPVAIPRGEVGELSLEPGRAGCDLGHARGPGAGHERHVRERDAAEHEPRDDTAATADSRRGQGTGEDRRDQDVEGGQDGEEIPVLAEVKP